MNAEMNETPDYSCQHLIEQYTADLLSGKDPSIDEYVDQCEVRDRDRLRSALLGAALVGPHRDVTEAAVTQTMDRIHAVQRQRDALAGLRARLEVAGAIPRAAADALKVLVAAVGAAEANRDRVRQPMAAYRALVPQVAADMVRETAGASARSSCAVGVKSDTPDRSAGGVDSRVSDIAERCLRAAMIVAAPVSVERLAQGLGLLVLDAPLDGCDGCLAVCEGAGVIVVNSEMPDAHRRRFTLAHEIAHSLLHGDQPTFSDTCGDLADYTTMREFEANTLAAHLLMPASLMPEGLLGAAPSLADGDLVAETFGVSLLAALRRLVRAAGEPCRLIVTREGEVTMTDTSPSAAASARLHSRAPTSSAITRLIGREPGAEAATEHALMDWMDWMPESVGNTRILEQTRMLDNGFAYTVLRHLR